MKKINEKLKDITEIQLVKAAQEFGTNTDAALNYLAYDDPDGDDNIGEPNFLTELGHSNKVHSIDKKVEIDKDDKDNKDKAEKKEDK